MKPNLTIYSPTEDIVIDFLENWLLEAVANPHKTGSVFQTNTGTCRCFGLYLDNLTARSSMRSHPQEVVDVNALIRRRDEVSRAYRVSLPGGYSIPFSNAEEYHKEVLLGTMGYNHKRMLWVELALNTLKSHRRFPTLAEYQSAPGHILEMVPRYLTTPIEAFYFILDEWVRWAENGAPKHILFNRRLGLCATFAALSNKLNLLDHDGPDWWYGLGMMFKSKLDVSYPFNTKESFYHEQDTETMHLNQQRIDWAKKACSTMLTRRRFPKRQQWAYDIINQWKWARAKALGEV